MVLRISFHDNKISSNSIRTMSENRTPLGYSSCSDKVFWFIILFNKPHNNWFRYSRNIGSSKLPTTSKTITITQ